MAERDEFFIYNILHLAYLQTQAPIFYKMNTHWYLSRQHRENPFVTKTQPLGINSPTSKVFNYHALSMTLHDLTVKKQSQIRPLKKNHLNKQNTDLKVHTMKKKKTTTTHRHIHKKHSCLHFNQK